MEEQTSAPVTEATAQTQTAEAPAQANASAEKMDAIVGKLAGKEPPKKEPEKPPEKPPETGKTKEAPGGVNKVLNRLRNSESKYAELEKKYEELQAKQKDGKASELDEYKMSQIQEQYNNLQDEYLQEYIARAQQELGDGYADFEESSKYYVPLLNGNAPEFANELAKMDSSFAIMNEFFKAFNDGSVDLKTFLELPAPRQIAVLRRVDYLMRNPQAPAAAPPPKAPTVPVPHDTTIGAPPADKNAMMGSIVSKMAGKM